MKDRAARSRIVFLPMTAFDVDEEDIKNTDEILQSVVGKGQPDRADNFLLLSALRLGVDDVRTVNDFASLRSMGDADKLLVIVALAITPESQNALLKIVEDSRALRTVIVVPQTARILPTLMSRCQIERPRITLEAEKDVQMWAEEMLKSPLPVRQKKVEALVKKSENHVIKSHMIAFVSVAREKGQPAESMSRALQLLSYAEQAGASHKLLLDALCLIL